jgi:hypothetical protein
MLSAWASQGFEAVVARFIVAAVATFHGSPFGSDPFGSAPSGPSARPGG